MFLFLGVGSRHEHTGSLHGRSRTSDERLPFNTHGKDGRTVADVVHHVPTEVGKAHENGEKSSNEQSSHDVTLRLVFHVI